MAAKKETVVKEVKFNARGKNAVAAIGALSDIDINANKGAVKAWLYVVRAVKAGEMLPSTEHATLLLNDVNERIMAWRVKHHDVRVVAPVNKQRANEVVSIMKLASYACFEKLFASLDGLDIGKNDLIALSRLIRGKAEDGGWAWKADKKDCPKTREQLIAAVRTARMKKHSNGNGKPKTTAQRQRAKSITAGNAVGSIDAMIGTIKGFLALDAFKASERTLNAMLNSAKEFRSTASAFAR